MFAGALSSAGWRCSYIKQDEAKVSRRRETLMKMDKKLSLLPGVLPEGKRRRLRSEVVQAAVKRAGRKAAMLKKARAFAKKK